MDTLNPAELAATLLIIALVTAIATDNLALPADIAQSPITVVLLVISALASFHIFPIVSLALFLLVAVLFFKRNVNMTLHSAKNNSETMYAETSIRMTQPQDAAMPYSSESSQPREYDQFQETNPANPMLGPLKEGFEPAPFGDEVGSPVDGQFFKEQERVEVNPTSQSYTYRPDASSGENTFERFGPELDEKITASAY